MQGDCNHQMLLPTFLDFPLLKVRPLALKLYHLHTMPSFLHTLRDKTRPKSHGKSHEKSPATPTPGPAEDTVHSTRPSSRDSPSQFTSRSAALDVCSGVFPPPSSAPDMDHPGQSSSTPPSAVPYLQPMSSINISGSALRELAY